MLQILLEGEYNYFQGMLCYVRKGETKKGDMETIPNSKNPITEAKFPILKACPH